VTLEGQIHVQLQLQEEEGLGHKLATAADNLVDSVKGSMSQPNPQGHQQQVHQQQHPPGQPAGTFAVAGCGGADASVMLDGGSARNTGGKGSTRGGPWIYGDIKIQVFKGRLIPRRAAVFKSPRSLFYAWVSK
jgi:hypothetical protein